MHAQRLSLFCYWNFLFSFSKASDANIGIIANVESTIMLSGSSQGESSVLRVRLRVVKKPITNTHQQNEYTLVEAQIRITST